MSSGKTVTKNPPARRVFSLVDDKGIDIAIVVDPGLSAARGRDTGAVSRTAGIKISGTVGDGNAIRMGEGDQHVAGAAAGRAIDECGTAAASEGHGDRRRAAGCGGRAATAVQGDLNDDGAAELVVHVHALRFYFAGYKQCGDGNEECCEFVFHLVLFLSGLDFKTRLFLGCCS